MSEPVAVKVGECRCPGHPHNGTGDLVYLRAKASVPLGFAVEGDILLAAGRSEMLQRMWAISYIRHGVVGWNFLDAKGQPRPLDIQEIIDDIDLGQPVAERADELYGDRVVNPLLERLWPSKDEPPPTSPPGPNGASTSANPESTPPPSKPSSAGRTGGKQSQTSP